MASYNLYLVEAHDRLGATRLVVKPALRTAAKIEIVSSQADDMVDVFLGRDTHLEVFSASDGYRITGLPFEDELRELLEAVVGGRFIERLWIDGATVTRSEAEIVLSEQAIQPRARHAEGDYRRARQEEVAYDPYC